MEFLLGVSTGVLTVVSGIGLFAWLSTPAKQLHHKDHIPPAWWHKHDIAYQDVNKCLECGLTGSDYDHMTCDAPCGRCGSRKKLELTARWNDGVMWTGRQKDGECQLCGGGHPTSVCSEL